jgi:DNA-binding IclR family transcriptional regulator
MPHNVIYFDRILMGTNTRHTAGGQGAQHAPGLPRTQSLTRAIGLLRALGGEADGAPTAALARACDLHAATAARLLATLADADFVERTVAGDGWTIGHELRRLVRAGDPDRRLLALATPRLEALAAASGESAALAVPRPGPGMDVVAQADSPGLLGTTDWVGRVFPLHASAPGKLVLAELPEPELAAWLERERPARLTSLTLADPRRLRAELARVRGAGYAELVDELEPGLASVAVAVRAPGATLTAMIGISGPTVRLDADRRKALLPEIRAAAAGLERDLASRSASASNAQ